MDSTLVQILRELFKLSQEVERLGQVVESQRQEISLLKNQAGQKGDAMAQVTAQSKDA